MFPLLRADPPVTALPLLPGTSLTFAITLFGLTALLAPAAQAQTAAPSHPATKAVTPAKTVRTSSTPKAATPAAAWTGNTTREFSVVAKSYKEKTTPQGAIVSVAGEVTITSLATKLHTDAATFDRTAQFATVPGKMQFDDVQQTLIGQSGTADYKTQEANLKGSVEITVRSSPEEGTKTVGTLTGDTVLYNWKDRIATVTGNTTLKLKDRTVTGDKAIYDGRAQTVTVTGNVSVVNIQGDKITGPKAILVLKQGAEETNLEDGINSVLKVQDGAAPVSAGNVAPTTQPTNNTPASGI